MNRHGTAPDAVLPDGPAVESFTREVDGVRLHLVGAGDRDEPLVVLLHGFPEFWYSWRRQIAPLAEAGFRVLTPDQRGYNRSGKPDGVRPYRTGRLVRDVIGLIDAAGRDSAHLVGHDLGGILAWELALRRPDAVDGLVAINAPHPTVFAETLTSNPRQLWRSRFVFFFQLPRLPERLLALWNYRLMVRELATARDGAFTDEDFERYRGAWRRPGTLTAMLNWYRALRYREDPPRERVCSPALALWSRGNTYLLEGMAERSVDRCEDGRLVRVPEATHWLHHEHPRLVADHVIDHLGE